jgi:hypothetical protein
MSNCKKKNCGCLDIGLITPTSCVHDTISCPNPDPCPETFSDECVVHTGDPIVELGINTGDRLDDILQLIALWYTNPTCVQPGAGCTSPIGLNSIAITTTTIKVGWNATSTATAYQIEYREISAMSWAINPTVTTTFDTIGGLLPGTSYYIRVKPTCALPNSCYSVTILVTTKSL